MSEHHAYHAQVLFITVMFLRCIFISKYSGCNTTYQMNSGASDICTEHQTLNTERSTANPTTVKQAVTKKSLPERQPVYGGKNSLS